MIRRLSNIDIDKILKSDRYTKKIYKGFLFPRENEDLSVKLDNLQVPSLYIVNTDYITESGLHWLLVIYCETRTLYFDPVGFPSLIYNLPFVIERLDTPLLRNIFTAQNYKSRSLSCGHFVVAYALLLARGLDFIDINRIFSKDGELNDEIVIEFIAWLARVRKLSKKTF
jgi:hypothetical protein